MKKLKPDLGPLSETGELPDYLPLECPSILNTGSVEEYPRRRRGNLDAVEETSTSSRKPRHRRGKTSTSSRKNLDIVEETSTPSRKPRRRRGNLDAAEETSTLSVLERRQAPI